MSFPLASIRVKLFPLETVVTIDLVPSLYSFSLFLYQSIVFSGESAVKYVAMPISWELGYTNSEGNLSF